MTREAYRKALRRLWQWAEAQQGGELVDVNAAALLRWKAELLKSVKPASANLYLAGVKAFYAWAAAAGVVRTNHAAALKSVKRVGIRQRHSRGWLTDAEAVRLLELEDIDARDKALISLMLFTGARGIELLRADLSDLRCEGPQCVLYVQGKGRSTSDKEPLVLEEEAQCSLNAWLRERGNAPGPLFTSHSRRSSGGRLAPSSLRQLIRAALAQAQGERMANTMRRLEMVGSLAIDALERGLRQEEPTAQQLRAAEITLSRMVRLRELLELESRISALENSLSEKES